MKINIILFSLIFPFVLFAQKDRSSLEVRSYDNRSAEIVENPELSSAQFKYQVFITDNLGDFQTQENLTVVVDETKWLRYNIGLSERSITLVFKTDRNGWHSYSISGRFLHRDGHWYDLTGEGHFFVSEDTNLNYKLFGDINTSEKKATAFFKTVNNNP